MAPSGRQRTFELVPNAPLGQQRVGNDPSPIFSKPPMTTKQAKKLYNQKNKGPKMSKAELRRIELMEQDRIRKEVEKEKAQARSRAIRDKKKAKEDAEKEERKRKGLPLVNIHPSQDTISRFLNREGRGLGKRQNSLITISRLASVEGDSETGTEACDDSDTDAGDEDRVWVDKENQIPLEDDPELERKAKRIRLNPPDDWSEDRRSPVPSQRQAGPLARIVQESGTDSYSRASSADTDDPINETLLEDQILDDLKQASSRIDSSQIADDRKPPTSSRVSQPVVTDVSAAPRSSERREPCKSPTPCPRNTDDRQLQTSTHVSQHVISNVSTALQLSAPRDISQPFAPCLVPPRQQPLQRITTPVARTISTAEARTAVRVPSHLADAAFKKPTSPYVRQGPPMRPPVFRAPNGPPKFKLPVARPNYSSERPRFLNKQISPAQQRRSPTIRQPLAQSNAYRLPTSTQAFLFNHADELFPSATQEARELAGDFLPEPPKPKAVIPKLSVNGTLYRSGINSLQRSRPEACPMPPEPAAPAARMSFDSSCLSTQDLIISTQDILDIDTPSKTAQVSANRVPQSRAAVQPQSLKVNTAKIRGPTITTNPTTLVIETDSVQDMRWQSSGTKASSAKAAVVVAPGSCGSSSSTRPFQMNRSSFPASYTAPSPQTKEREPDVAMKAANRPLRSSYQRHAAAVQQRSTPASSRKIISAQAPDPIITPKNPPPKRRMFGSSGPGPEGLVAMERSYQEMKREERVQKEQLRARERLVETAKWPAEQLDLDLTDFADDLLDDDFGCSFGKESFRAQSGNINAKNTGVTEEQAPSSRATVRAQAVSQLRADAGGHVCPVASQETDYGDIDGDEFDFLKGDTSWLDDDLDDIL